VLDGNLDGKPILSGKISFRQNAVNQWWDDELIIKINQLTITRQKLVYALRNKDGGSHVDPVVTGHYVELLKVPPMKSCLCAFMSSALAGH
jgi:hypothetical protein